MNIALHMEQLVLTGVDLSSGQRAVLQASVEGELARLLGQGTVAPALGGGAMVGRLEAAPIEIGPRPDPVRLGEQIAQSLYGAMAPTQAVAP
jgi:hypothetical protein